MRTQRHTAHLLLGRARRPTGSARGDAPGASLLPAGTDLLSDSTKATRMGTPGELHGLTARRMPGRRDGYPWRR